ncbi:hypothetical protein [Paenibacillus sp. Marseille-Q4541]|uniref:hypothetical protein n=1 Tax=Paenibacillus sp. Marseille-Q4541 TaxID=2831522 RepID=UPI001BA915A2|nr:hypothetical protein [Paenibacillus sp. Marseille-Q4541]
MNKIVVSRKVNYEKQEVDELERASLQVQSIYDRAATMVKQFYFSSDANHSKAVRQLPRTYFQKWINTTSGWKYVGSEYDPGSPENVVTNTEVKSDTSIFCSNKLSTLLSEHGKPITSFISLFLQAIIWSQYEEIRLFHPFLGADSFFSEDEMDIIAAYFVPTYFSEQPLSSSGKSYRKRNITIPVYQEDLHPSSVIFDADASRVEGRLTTGVYISEQQFKGLGPYFKSMSGNRIYMQAAVQ